MPTIPMQGEASVRDCSTKRDACGMFGCCCSNELQPDSQERGPNSGSLTDMGSIESIPVVDYDDGPLGMYAPQVPRLVMERATASSPCKSATGMSTKSQYCVELTRKDGEKLGLDVDFKQERTSLPIIGIKGGMAERWNMMNPDHPLLEGDSIIEVNGTSQDAAAMVQLCQKAAELRLVLMRGNGVSRFADRNGQNCLSCRSRGSQDSENSSWNWLLGGGCATTN